MQKIFLASILSVFCAVAMAADMPPAGGYYETHTQNCDRASMQAALDRATAERRAVITVVKCTPDVASDVVADDAVYMDDAPVEYGPYVDCSECDGYVTRRQIVERTYIEETYSVQL